MKTKTVSSGKKSKKNLRDDSTTKDKGCKKAEEKIMEREHYFRSILYAMHEGVIVIDRNYRITDVNNALLQNIGKLRTEVIGRKCYEILHGHDTPCGEKNKECMLEKAFKTGRYTEYMREIIEIDGSKKWLDIILSPLKDDEGNIVQVIQTVRDVSEIIKTQEMLRRHEHIVSTCSDLLSFIDKNYVYLAINKAYTEAFNKEEEEILNHTIAEVFGRELFEERIKPKIDRAFAGERFQYQAWFDFPGWGRTYLDTVFHPYFGEDGQVEGVVVCARNSTDFKNLEVQLTQAQKLETIGRLAAGIAHEINTPMQYIGDNAGFLKDSFAEIGSLFEEYKKFLNEVKSRSVLPEEVSRMEEVVQKADFEFLAEEIPDAIKQTLEGIERVVKIVRAMKEFSHPGLDERKPIDLNHAIESTITVSRNEWKYVADVETDFDTDMPNVVCLPGEFKQVILNLIVNAAHAIGDVVKDGTNGNKGMIRISTRYEEDCAIVRISDTGGGIPEEVRDKIFNPFFTTKEVGKGTGQGLSIAHSVITKKHKGKIDFETEMGKGTTFIISLPIEENAEKREEVKKE